MIVRELKVYKKIKKSLENKTDFWENFHSRANFLW